MIELGQMYRPMYNAVNIEIHAPQNNMAPQMPQLPPMPQQREENEGKYACPRCSMYDIPKTSIYKREDVAPQKPQDNRVLVFPQQTVIEHAKHKNIEKAHVTNPIKNVNKVSEQVISQKIEKKEIVNNTKKIDKADKAEKIAETVAPKKIEIVKGVNLKPVIDINTFIAELTNPDFSRQADAMGTIAEVSAVSPEIGSHLLDVKVVDTLLGIMTKDTSDLAAPTPRQLAIREAVMRGHNVSPQDLKEASIKAPVEMAEENKAYAMYTLAAMQKVYSSEVEKMGNKVVPLRELPGANEIIKEVETNQNPRVKIAGLNALNYVQRPEYKADLQAIYQKASQDENPAVREYAQKATQLLG
jgi:hypothetical protein